MKKYKLLLFDFDYTLVDSSKGIINCYVYAFNKVGERIPNKNKIKKTIGMSLEDSYLQLSTSPDKRRYSEFRKNFMICSKESMADYVEVFEDTIEVLKKIRMDGIKIAIVSAKDKETIERISTKYDFLKYVDIVIGENEVKRQKPNPESVELAIKATGINKNDTLFVGDSLMDACAAKEAKVDFLPVITGVTNEILFKDYPKIGVIQQLIHVLDYV